MALNVADTVRADHYTPNEQKRLFFRRVKLILKILSTLTAAFGLYSLLSLLQLLIDLSLHSATFSESSSTTLLVIISLYAASWIWGLKSDIYHQELTFGPGTNKGKLPPAGLTITIISATIFLVGFLLAAKSSNVPLLSELLLIFLITNILGWIWLKRFYSTIIEKDLNSYRTDGNYFKFLRLNEVKWWLIADWQKYRFFGAFLILVVINIFLNSSVGTHLDVLYESSGFAPNAVPICLISIYIGFLEISIWYHRLKRNYTIDYLSYLEARYDLSQNIGDPGTVDGAMLTAGTTDDSPSEASQFRAEQTSIGGKAE